MQRLRKARLKEANNLLEKPTANELTIIRSFTKVVCDMCGLDFVKLETTGFNKENYRPIASVIVYFLGRYTDIAPAKMVGYFECFMSEDIPAESIMKVYRQIGNVMLIANLVEGLGTKMEDVLTMLKNTEQNIDKHIRPYNRIHNHQGVCDMLDALNALELCLPPVTLRRCDTIKQKAVVAVNKNKYKNMIDPSIQPVIVVFDV